MVSRGKEKKTFVKSALRVLDIAEFLNLRNGGATLFEISRDLNIPPSSCHSLIQTLLVRGYLSKEEGNGHYRLTWKWNQFYNLEDLDLIEYADPWMTEIFRLTGESISLAIQEEDDIVFIHKKTSQDSVRIVNPVGTRMPLHSTALGKAILAYWPKKRLEVWLADRTLNPVTINTITSKTELQICLDKIRDEGVAYDREESRIDVLAMASCIRNESNEPIAALSIAVLKHLEHGDEYWSKLRKIIKASAEMISFAMGCKEMIEPITLNQLGEY